MTQQTLKLIPALDVLALDDALRMVETVDDQQSVYGYKIGFTLGLGYGLPKVCAAIRELSTKPLIYDHQKASPEPASPRPSCSRTRAHKPKPPGLRPSKPRSSRSSSAAS